jgi:CBS domain-containing protein
MHVAEILREKGRAVETADKTEAVSRIVEKLASKRIGAVVIVDRAGRLEGIVSERDVVHAMAKNGAETMGLQAGAIMTRDVITCNENDTIDELMAAMTAHRFRHLPVVEGGELVGIVSIGDVVKYRVAEVELEASAMRGYITAG